MNRMILAVACIVAAMAAAKAQPAPSLKDLGDASKVTPLVGKEVALTGILAYRGMQMGTLNETADVFGAGVELDLSTYPADKLAAIPAACKASPGAAGGCRAKVTGTLAAGNVRAASLKVTAIEEVK
jgi:hypothetical protein